MINLARQLVARNGFGGVRAQGLERRRRAATARNDPRDHTLTPLSIRARRHHHPGDLRVSGKRGFHLGRPDLLAATDDHIGEPSPDAHAAVHRDRSSISGAQPAPGRERGRSRSGVESIPAHQRRAANQQLAGFFRAYLDAGKWPSGVDDSAAGLGHPVGRHYRRTRLRRPARQLWTHSGTTDQDRPEPVQRDVRVEQAEQLRRDHRCEAHVGQRGERCGGHASAEADWGAEEEVPVGHQQPADVGQGKAGQPPIPAAGADRRGRRPDCRRHRIARQFHEARMTRRPGGGDDQCDAVSRRHAFEPAEPVRPEADGRLRQGEEGGALRGGQPDVDGQYRGTHVARHAQRRQPRSRRGHRHCDKVAGAERATQVSERHGVERTPGACAEPGGLPSNASNSRSA